MPHVPTSDTSRKMIVEDFQRFGAGAAVRNAVVCWNTILASLIRITDNPQLARNLSVQSYGARNRPYISMDIHPDAEFTWRNPFKQNNTMAEASSRVRLEGKLL